MLCHLRDLCAPGIILHRDTYCPLPLRGRLHRFYFTVPSWQSGVSFGFLWPDLRRKKQLHQRKGIPASWHERPSGTFCRIRSIPCLSRVWDGVGEFTLIRFSIVAWTSRCVTYRFVFLRITQWFVATPGGRIKAKSGVRCSYSPCTYR